MNATSIQSEVQQKQKILFLSPGFQEVLWPLIGSDENCMPTLSWSEGRIIMSWSGHSDEHLERC
jgi:hypothetical protein